MKKLLSLLLMAFITGAITFYSCKKENAHGGNNPPIANAGKDTTIILPENSAILNGTASTDPDGAIASYEWTKIAGPSSYTIADSNAAQTQVENLIGGIYQFQLKVTDALGLISRDTVMVEVGRLPSQQNLTDVNFYWTDPTKTVNFIIDNYSVACMAWDYHGSDLRLVTIKLDTLSGFIAGIWCQNCLPDCSSWTYIFSIEDGATVKFTLPPGTYNWSAETTLNAFPLSLSNNPGVTQQFFDFFNTTHKTNGTITVKPGDSCIIQKIVFP